MTTLTAFIFARGGSKGLPGKNVKPLAGKPLIGWAVEAALATARVKTVIVSTDSPEIAEVARAHGAETPFVRPDALAADTASEWDAWRHALSFMRDRDGALPEAFLSVPATAPLRLPEDIDACLDLYEEGDADAVIATTEAAANPWFNMVARDEAGCVRPVNNPDGAIARRQDAPEVYDITPIAYVADPEFVMTRPRLFDGRVRAVTIPRERAVDIDTAEDFEYADFLMRKRLAGSGASANAD